MDPDVFVVVFGITQGMGESPYYDGYWNLHLIPRIGEEISLPFGRGIREVTRVIYIPSPTGGRPMIRIYVRDYDETP